MRLTLILLLAFSTLASSNVISQTPPELFLNTFREILAKVYDRDDLDSCFRRLVDSFPPFSPIELADIENCQDSNFERVEPLSTKEEAFAVMQSRSPPLWNAILARKPIIDKLLAKLDTEAEQFVRNRWDAYLEMLVAMSHHNDVKHIVNAVEQTQIDYYRLPQSSRDSLHEVLCLDTLSRAFPNAFPNNYHERSDL